MAVGLKENGRIEQQRLADRERALLALVHSRRQESLDYNQSLFQRLDSFYAVYRGLRQGGAAKFRNDISIPFTFAMIQSNVSRLVQALFGSWPIVEFEGYAPEDAPRAKRNTVLISAQMKDTNSINRAANFFLQADIFGTGIGRVGWRRLQRMNRYRERVSVAPGLDITVPTQGFHTLFDGPTWEPIDRRDFWQQPARTNLDDMGWVIHRYWADLDDLKEDARSDEPYFIPSAVNRLAQFPIERSEYTDHFQRRVAFRYEQDNMARMKEKYAKPVEIWEMHGLVPAELAKDGIRHRCIAVGNGRVVLRDSESILGNQSLPFFKYSGMVDPTSFDGIGKAEIAYGPQRTVDRIANQKLDALDLLIDPMYVANSGAGLNTGNLFSRAGRILLVDGPADDSSIRPLTPDMRGLQAAYQEIGQLFQFMQLGTGETESLLGVSGGPSRETARGFLGRQENALNRMSMESTLASENFVEPLANFFRHMDRLWLTMPHQVKILGSMATVNPVTGLPYEQESLTVDLDDLAPDYRARAVGANRMVGQAMRRQDYLAFTQLIQSNPILAQVWNWVNWAREGAQLFGFTNTNDYIVSMLPAINQLSEQSGQSPDAIAGTAGLPLDQLSPDLIATMGGQPQAPMQSGGLEN